MSYAAPPPVDAAPRRPVTVALAALLLAVMAVVGLGYAVVTLAVAPGVVSRFRAAASGFAAAEVDGLVTLVWVVAGIAVALAVILFALYVVLALGLRRGSNASRVATWVVCALGLLAGCGSAVTVLSQRGGPGDDASLGAALTDAYPGGWTGLNLTLAIAQMVGYAAVAGLLLASPAAYFGRGRAQVPAAPGPYGSYGALPGMPGLYDGGSAPAGGGPANPYAPPGAHGQYGQPGQYGEPGQPAQPGQPGQPAQPGQYGQPGPYGAPYGGTPQPNGAPPPHGPQPSGRPWTEPGPDDEFWSRPST